MHLNKKQLAELQKKIHSSNRAFHNLVVAFAGILRSNQCSSKTVNDALKLAMYRNDKRMAANARLGELIRKAV